MAVAAVASPMESQFPSLGPGVTLVETDAATGAVHGLVGRHLEESRGVAYWLDVGGTASTRAFERASRRARERVRVARAFTGYQHFELARGLVGRARGTTAAVVAPNVDALYADDDVPDYEADDLFAATLELLAAVGAAVDAPVVLTSAGTGYADRVREAAADVIAVEETRMGLRFDAPDFRTDVYWDGWGFQTTIPYWVDLLGTAAPVADPSLVEEAVA